MLPIYYGSFGYAESAVKHANEFPCRVDMIVHVMWVWINKAFNEFENNVN